LARAGVDTTDLALACSTALGPVMHRAAEVFREQSGVRLHVFAASPGLVHAQLQREVQIDLVAMGLREMEDLAVRKLLAPPPYTGPWRNRLVMAGRRGMALTTAMAGTVAVPDAGTAAGLDGPAILAQAGWRPGRRLGVVDTAEAAALLSAGAVTAALLYLSEVRADMLLAELAPVPQAASPDVQVAASVTAGARRPNPRAFLQFLATAFGRRMLAEGGLEELA
jgi:molybdate transport system substrate-binding protein